MIPGGCKWVDRLEFDGLGVLRMVTRNSSRRRKSYSSRSDSQVLQIFSKISKSYAEESIELRDFKRLSMLFIFSNPPFGVFVWFLRSFSSDGLLLLPSESYSFAISSCFSLFSRFTIYAINSSIAALNSPLNSAILAISSFPFSSKLFTWSEIFSFLSCSLYSSPICPSSGF